MEEDKLMELFDQFRKDPRLKEALLKTEIPDDHEKTVTLLADLAKEFGYMLSEEDLITVTHAVEKKRKDATKRSVEEIEQLPDDDLARVAGGKDKHNERCLDTYMDMENCWYTDGCDTNVIMYPDYTCYGKDHGGFGEGCGVPEAITYCQSLLV